MQDSILKEKERKKIKKVRNPSEEKIAHGMHMMDMRSYHHLEHTINQKMSNLFQENDTNFLVNNPFYYSLFL